MSRIGLATVVVVLAAAGCGSSGQSSGPAAGGVPRELARVWAAQATAIAGAAAAGDTCKALRLARSLRIEVTARERQLPARVRSPLVAGVDALAARITCTPPPVTGPAEPKPHEKHPHHHHGHGGDQRNQS